MKFVLLILFILFPSILLAKIDCKETEIYVSAHSVKGYVTTKGKRVSGYKRDESCRNSPYSFSNFEFRDTAPINSNPKENFKEWKKSEISYFLKLSEKLPKLLKNIPFHALYRAHVSSFKENPAATFPDSKYIIFYDSFFQRSDSLKVLGHEISHLLYWKMSDDQKLDFARISGWKRKRGKIERTPLNPIYADSVNGPAEDFANNVEAFYFDKERLRNNNPDLLNFLTGLEKEIK